MESQTFEVVPLNEKQKIAELKKNVDTEILDWNVEFVSHTRHPDKSFHNIDHFRSVAIAAEIVRQLSSDQDPTNFKKDLKKYYEQNHITLQENDEEIIVYLYGMTHDLGNQIESVVIENNQLKPIYNKRDGKNTFKATGAEERSKTIADKFIAHHLNRIGITDTDRIRNISLITKEMIEQTKMSGEKEYNDSPFAFFSRVTDRIGGMLVQNPSREEYIQKQLGLLDEIFHESAEPILIKAKRLANFFRYELEKICGKDMGKRDKILRAFQGTTETPKNLIYEDKDPDIKSIKLHPLAIRTEVLTKLHPERKNFLPNKGDGYKNMIFGAVLEVLADKYLREGKEMKLIEREFLQVLRQPGSFDLDTSKIAKNPDLIEISFDQESNSFKILGFTEVKSSNRLDIRGVIQLSNKGSLKSVKNFCDYLNQPATTPETLRKKKLYDLAEKKSAWMRGGGVGKFIDLSEDPKIKIIIPATLDGDKTLKLPTIDPKDKENYSFFEEVDAKIKSGRIEVIALPYTHQDIRNLVKKIYPS